MQVPDAAIVLLGFFSLLFFIMVAFLSYSVVKETLRKRKYCQYGYEKQDQFISGKMKAYFHSDYHMVVPKAYPKAVQSRPFRHISEDLSNSQCSDDSFLQLNDSWGTEERNFPIRNIEQRVFPTFTTYSRPKISEGGSLERKLIKSKKKNTDKNYFSDTLSVCSTFQDNNTTTNFEEPLFNYNVQKPMLYESHFSPGLLSFSLQYVPETVELKIKIKQAFDLQKVDHSPKTEINSYAMFCLIPEDFSWQRTVTIKNSRDPIFNEEFIFADILYHKLREYTLMVFAMDLEEGERPIGKLMYPLSDIPQNCCIEITKELTVT